MQHEELLVLVDEKGQPVGQAPKLASHHADTPLHLAFSCYIFNEAGQLLLTQRAKSKKVWPGVWTNSVCGHPAPKESLEAAITRRARFELGITKLKSVQLVLPTYRYTTPPFQGIIENEFCPVFIAQTTQQPRPNPEEVDAFRWTNWETIPALIQTSPDAYSYWFKDQLPLLQSSPVLQNYIRTLKDS